jgi:hypothetical protein
MKSGLVVSRCTGGTIRTDKFLVAPIQYNAFCTRGLVIAAINNSKQNRLKGPLHSRLTNQTRQMEAATKAYTSVAMVPLVGPSGLETLNRIDQKLYPFFYKSQNAVTGNRVA